MWAVGLFFETVGDAQLQAFRDDPASKGKVLDTGLWRYTRHPNYFGDACVWWGIFLVSAQAWPGVLTVLSPLVMTYLLANGSGKPLLEKGMSSRRPGYDEYVRRTSGFVPLPPKKTPPGPPPGELTVLSTGDTVPDFELPDETGTPRRLSTLLQDGPVALFWYPVASSGGCTAEACHFRDLAGEFAARGRAAGRHQHRPGRPRRPSSSAAPVWTTRCSPTPTARSPSSSASAASGSRRRRSSARPS